MTIIDLLDDEITKDGYWINEDSPYIYNGVKVPRVTNILQSTNHEQYLIEWANRMGFAHKRYADIMESASKIGTAAHNAIELRLSNNDKNSPYELLCKLDNSYQIPANNAYKSFLLWLDDVTPCGFEVIKEEEPLITPFFGGTMDLLARIAGCVVLIDFKTSNHPNFKYFLQLAAYRSVIEEQYGIKIDYVMILMLDKKTPQYTEHVLDLSLQEHQIFMDHFTKAFYASLYQYYMRVRAENDFRRIISRGK